MRRREEDASMLHDFKTHYNALNIQGYDDDDLMLSD